MNKNKKIKKEIRYVDQLLRKPVIDKKNKSKFPTTLYKPNFIHQIHLLFLPYNKDHKERYAIVAIDMSTRLIDSEPIKKQRFEKCCRIIKKDL